MSAFDQTPSFRTTPKRLARHSGMGSLWHCTDSWLVDTPWTLFVINKLINKFIYLFIQSTDIHKMQTKRNTLNYETTVPMEKVQGYGAYPKY